MAYAAVTVMKKPELKLCYGTWLKTAETRWVMLWAEGGASLPVFFTRLFSGIMLMYFRIIKFLFE